MEIPMAARRGEVPSPALRLAPLKDTSRSPEPGQRLLEAGSGLGQAAVDCCEHYDLAHVLGMNMCEPQVRFANALAKHMGLDDRVEHKVCDACEEVNALPAGSYHHAFAQECIGHFPDPLAYLKGVHRVLAPGGRMAITVVTSPKPPGWGLAFVEKLFFGCVPEHASYWSDLFAQAGFQNVQSHDITHMVFAPLFQAVRKRLLESPEAMDFQGPIGRFALRSLLEQTEKGIQNKTMGYQLVVGEATTV